MHPIRPVALLTLSALACAGLCLTAEAPLAIPSTVRLLPPASRAAAEGLEAEARTALAKLNPAQEASALRRLAGLHLAETRKRYLDEGENARASVTLLERAKALLPANLARLDRTQFRMDLAEAHIADGQGGSQSTELGTIAASLHSAQAYGLEAEARRLLALTLWEKDPERTDQLLRASIKLANQAKKPAQEALGHRLLAKFLARGPELWVTRGPDLLGEVKTHFEQTLALHRRLTDRAGEAMDLATFGDLKADHDDNENAIRPYRQALELYRTVPDQCQAAAILNRLGLCFIDLGRYDEARKVLQDGLGTTFDEHPIDIKLHAFLLHNMGLSYFRQKDWCAAKAWFDQSLALSQAAHFLRGEFVSRTLEAQLLEESGQPEAAIEAHLVLLERMQAEPMATPESEWETRLKIMALYEQLNEVEQALAFGKASLARFEQLQDRKSYASVCQRLGGLFEDAQPSVALDWYQKAAGAVRPQVEGSEPGRDAAFDFTIHRDDDKTVAFCLRALAERERTLGQTDPKTLQAMRILAIVYQNALQADQAEATYRRMLAIQEASLGPEHPETLHTLDTLAQLLEDLVKYDQADLLFRKCLTLRERSLGLNHQESLRSLNNLTRNLLEAGRYKEAESLCRDSLARCKGTLGLEHPVTLESQLRLGELLFDTSRQAEAEPLLRSVLLARERDLGPNSELTLQTLHLLARLLSSVGDYQEADTLNYRWNTGVYSSPLENSPSSTNHLKVLMEMDKQVVFLLRNKEFEAAIPICRRLLAERRKTLGMTHPHTLATLEALGTLLRDAGRTEEAEKTLRHLIKLTARKYGATSIEAVLCAGPLAILLSDTGRYSEAESLLRKGIATSEKLGGSTHPVVLEFVSTLADLLRRTGRLVEAESMYRRVQVGNEKMGPSLYPSTQEIMVGFALVLQDTGRKAEAEAFLRRTIEVQGKMLFHDHIMVLRANQSLANLLASRGQDSEAEMLYRRVHAALVGVRGAEHPDTLSCLIDLGEFLGTTHRSEEAEDLLHRALGSPALADSPELYCRALWCAGRITRSQGRAEEAVFLFKCAVNAAQSMRGETARINRDAERAFLKTLAVSYRDLADFLISLNRFSEAEEILGLLKEEELSAFGSGERLERQTRHTATFVGPESTWAEDFLQFRSHLMAMLRREEAVALGDSPSTSAKPVGSESSRTIKPERLDRANRKAAEFFDRLKAEAAGVKFASNPPIPSVETLQASLRNAPPGTVIVRYLLLPERIHILLTTAEHKTVHAIPVTEGKFIETLDTFRNALKDDWQDPKESGKQLYDWLIAPIEKDLEEEGAKTLMLSLDGGLRYIPFGALWDGKRYLVQRWATVMVAEAGQMSAHTADTPASRFQGFGLSDQVEGFNALPAVGRELKAITAVLPGPVKLNKAFTRKALEASLAHRPGVLHISSHFLFSPLGSAESFLVLGDGSHFSLRDIDRSPMQFSSLDLLTLSACETGVGGGKEANGLEVESLRARLQMKGAKAVLATLWPVDDDSTGAFMADFYRRWKHTKGETKAEAMRQAQVALIQGRTNGIAAPTRGGASTSEKHDWTHPYYWAPFVLSGDWR